MTHESNWEDSKYITNAEFVHLVLEKKSAPYLPLIVIGKVDFRGLEFEKSLYFTDIWFQGGVSLDTAKLGGDLDFSNCRFDDVLRATDTRIAASVSISRCTFSRTDPNNGKSISFDNTVIGGDFHLSDITGRADDVEPEDAFMKGGVSLCDATIDGSCSISKVVIGSADNPVEGLINLDQTKVVGNLNIVPGTKSGAPFQSKVPEKLILYGGITGKGLTVGGDLSVGSEEKSHSTITGAMNFSHSKISGEVKINGFRNDEFECPLNKKRFLTKLLLNQITCGSCSITSIDCERFSLSGSNCEGQISVRFLNAKGPNPDDSHSVRADFSMVTSSGIFIDNVSVVGDLYFINTHVRSVLRFGSVEPNGRVFAGVSVDGNIDFSSARVDGQINIISSIAKGVVRLNGTQCGSMLMKAVNSVDHLIGDHMHFCRDDDFFLQKGSNNQENKYYIFRNRFGALDMVDCQFVSYVTLSGLEIIDPATNEILEDNTEPLFTGILISACSFGNGLRFWKSGRSSGDGKQTRYTAWQNDLNRSIVDGRLEIRDCQIKGDLDLTRVYIHALTDDLPGHDHKVEEDEVFEGGALHGGIILDRTKVEGDILFLSPSSVAADLTQPKYLRKCASDYETERQSRKLAKAKENPEEQQLEEQKEVDRSAKAHFLQMKGTQANNIDLTGLSLKDPEGKLAEHFRHGHVIADNMVLSGALTCYVADFQSDKGHSGEFNKEAAISRKEGYANIPGSLRLSGSELDELSISRKSFSKEIKEYDNNDPDRLSENALLDGLSLDGATIGELTIHKTPIDLNDRSKSVFPYPINFSALKVSNWIFVDEQGVGIEDEDELARCYTGVLENGELYRDVYRDVYRQLRNNGKNDAAVGVFVAEHDKAYEKLSGFRATIKSYIANKKYELASDLVDTKLMWFINAILGGIWTFFTAMLTKVWRSLFYKPLFAGIMKYGAEPNMLGWVIVAFMLFTGTLVAPQSANFELSANAKMIMANQDPGLANNQSRLAALGMEYTTDRNTIGPRADHWDGIDATWMTLRYHIPIVAIVARGEYEPTNDRGVQIIGMDEPLFDWLTPEDWFMIMALLNWTLLPVLLTFWLNKILRNGEL